MKVTYLERLENRLALSRNMFCPYCGAHEYTIVEQLEPATIFPWMIRCPQCEYEIPACENKQDAILYWRNK